MCIHVFNNSAHVCSWRPESKLLFSFGICSHLFKIQQGLSLNSLAVSEPQRASSCCLVWGWGWRGLSAGECLLPSHNHTTQFTRTCSSSPRGPNTSTSQHTHRYTLTVDSEMEPRFPGLYSDFFSKCLPALKFFELPMDLPAETQGSCPLG